MSKHAHILILDAGPILRNDPSISTLQAKCDQLYTTSAIVSEIRDPVAKSRFESTYLPFLRIRDPKSHSITIITEYSRKTADLAALSRGDIGILALAYELECEMNGGDWRLRSTPGQKRLNGSPPTKDSTGSSEVVAQEGNLEQRILAQPIQHSEGVQDDGHDVERLVDDLISAVIDNLDLEPDNLHHQVCEGVKTLSQVSANLDSAEDTKSLTGEAEQDTSDSDGWITPSNLRKLQAKDNGSKSGSTPGTSTLQVATLTTDFAMQNVLLHMNLNLISTSLQQIRHIRTYILRCHGCFEKTKDMSRQFCPRCGNPTLTRVSCSTNDRGEFKLHMKKTMQWNSRGDRYSIPKPVAGSANQKVAKHKGGGRGGWGQELILAEDQKEYMRAVQSRGRRKETDLMDEDYLPGILTGERSRTGGRPTIGAGRNINSKKRR